MPTDEQRVLVGLVARAHGLRGEVVVEVLSDAPERFAPGSVVTGSPPALAAGRGRRGGARGSRPSRAAGTATAGSGAAAGAASGGAGTGGAESAAQERVTRELHVTESRPFQGRLLVRFEGIESREDAEAIHGYELSIARGQVASLPEGRLYRFQLVGLEVRTTAGESIGRVTDVFATGSNDVLVVDGDDREILVPMLEGVIVSIDAETGIVIEPPPGLPGLSDA